MTVVSTIARPGIGLGTPRHFRGHTVVARHEPAVEREHLVCRGDRPLMRDDDEDIRDGDGCETGGSQNGQHFALTLP
jgi:hypothetical protein